MKKHLQSIGLNTEDNFYVIAEIGINHGGNLDAAFALIDSAAKTGCHAVKFQTYKTEKRVNDSKNPIFKILKDCELKLESFEKLKIFAESKGLDFFSTPFDLESLAYLNKIGTQIFKIASFDVTNAHLLNAVAETQNTILMSVGMASMEEIRRAYQLIHKRTKQLAILHCVSSYPLEPNDANLRCIRTLIEDFNCVVGYSDHTDGIETSLLSFAVGAQIIEKHYKLDEQHDCVDAQVSITESQMSELIRNLRKCDKILGSREPNLRLSEQSTTVFRRHSDF